MSVGSMILSSIRRAGEVKLLQKARTPEQQAAIKYFLAGGCCGGGLLGWNDREFDSHLAQKVSSVDMHSNALRKFGLDASQVKEIPPIFVDGYFVDWEAVGRGEIFLKEGKDNLTRASSYQLTCLLAGREQLYSYSYRFSTVNLAEYEEAEEFFYRDIDSVSMDIDTKDKQVPGKGCLGMFNFRYVANPSLKLYITVPGNKFVCAMRPENEQVVMGLRNLIRDKKNG